MKPIQKIFGLALILVALLALAACQPSASTAENVAENSAAEEEHTVQLPIVGAPGEEASEAKPTDPEPPTEASPAPATEAPAEAEAYPVPEMVTPTQPAANSDPTEAYPAPEETATPAQVLKVTSRGDNLVATSPSTVELASGQLQFVEFFAFW